MAGRHGDRAEMARVQRHHVAVDVGDRQPALGDAAVEVVLVSLVLLALVEPREVFIAELVFIPLFFDGFNFSKPSIFNRWFTKIALFV